MINRSKTILGVTATIVLVIAFTLDITSFGQDKNISWSSIYLIRILITVASVATAGLLLGLFLFRSQHYKARIKSTVPIAFILFSVAVIIMSAINYHGLNEDYNYFSAQRDIKNGKIQILEIGLILPERSVDWNKLQETEKMIGKHFGYSSVYLGCTVTNGILIYNSVMRAHLDKVYGPTWRAKRQNMVDSIMTFKIR